VSGINAQRVATTEARLLRLPEVCLKVGLGKTMLYRMIKLGLFPSPLKIGRASLWPAALVDSWIAEKIGG
jgi:prophage regulatory protein